MYRYRLLLVDDDEAVRAVIKKNFGAVHGLNFEFIEADRLSAAIGILENNGIDGVITDLKLDDAGEMDAVIRLRKASPTVPIIVLSGFIDYEGTVKAIRLGADYVRQKPPDNYRRMAEAMGQAIEKRSVSRGQTAIIQRKWRRKEWLKFVALATALAG